MRCKGICTRHKPKGSIIGGRYSKGNKRCQICDIFIQWEGLRCPCCGVQLRGSPRNKKYKAKFRESKVQQQQPLLSISN